MTGFRRAITALLLLALLCALSGCGDGVIRATEDPGPAVSREPVPLVTGEQAFCPPVGLFDVDLTAEDPSNSQITFLYDDRGRIALCQYEISGVTIYLKYSYNGKSIRIDAYADIKEVTHEYYEAKAEYDPSIPFIVHDGYYFKGFAF